MTISFFPEKTNEQKNIPIIQIMDEIYNILEKQKEI